MTMRRVVITGLGIVSPLGSDLHTFWNGLSQGHSGIRPLSCFNTNGYSSTIGGEVRDFDPTDFINRKHARRMGRASQFAVASSLMAVGDAGLDLDREDRSNIAICMGTSIAGMKEAFDAYELFLKNDGQHTNPFTMIATFPNAVSGEVAIALGIHGDCETYSIGCSSTANALGRACQLIQSGSASLVIAGGSEAPLHPGIFAAMEAGRVLASDHQGTILNLPRPFDRSRCGMVLGEGAGSVILEDYDHACARGARIYGEVEGWSATCDAFSMARPATTGKEQARAIQRALTSANWFPEEVDYINACGLGAIDLDLVETSAIKQALGSHAYRVPITSFKAALGHAFAASGAFQVVGTVLAIEHQYLPPTLNLSNPDPDCDLDYVPGEGRSCRVQRALINSFGFGGKNVVLAVSNGGATVSEEVLFGNSWATTFNAAPVGSLCGSPDVSGMIIH